MSVGVSLSSSKYRGSLIIGVPLIVGSPVSVGLPLNVEVPLSFTPKLANSNRK